MKAKEKPRDSVTKPLTVVGRVAKLLVGTCICTIFFLIGTGSQAMHEHSETTTSILVSQSSRDTRPDAVTKLVAGVPRTNDYFGTSVAVSGDTAIVGAPVAASGSPNNNGAAYIYVRNGSGWSLQQRLFASDSPADDRDGFGLSVAISGETAIVGSPRRGDQNDEAGYGAVYIFARNGATWTLQKKLSPIDTPLAECESEFGRSVAISGDTVLISTGGCIESGDNESVVHVFVRTGAAWAPQTMLLSPSVPNDDFFGTSVALQGDMAIVGDPGDSTGTRPETASVFYRCGTVWTRQQTLSASDGASAERSFGASVAISGNSVIIGAKDDRLGTANRIQGSAYVFTSDGTTWTEQQKLTQDDGSLSSRFGSSVAIFGNIAVIGKPVSVTANQGSAFTFGRSGNTWTLQDTYTAGDGAAGDEFGSSVAISANAVIVGARLDDAGTTQTNEGSAYAIDRTSAPPSAFSPPCENSITVNITTDQRDANLSDEICDVDLLTSGNQCSLRAAIQTANAKAGPDEIKFDIPGTGVHTISPTSGLPSITDTVSIIANTQPGYVDKPMVQLNGGNGTGLFFDMGSSGSTLNGLAVNRWTTGIRVDSNNVTITGVHIGIDADGITIPPVEDRQIDGIEIRGQNNSVLGSRDAMSRASNSDITGNQLRGIYINGAGATGNRVSGVDFGFANGKVPDESITVSQISIEQAQNNTIGGTTNADLNVIAAPDGDAIELDRGASNNFVKGNSIGFCGTAIFIGQASNNNQIGGARDAGERNYISNCETAVQVGYPFQVPDTPPFAPAIGTKIYGNVIGINDRDIFAGNDVGIFVGVARDTQIGSGSFGEHNFISGSFFDGVVITKYATETRVRGNFIGTDFTGTTIHPNRDGIQVAGNGSEISKNVISGNNSYGIAVTRYLQDDPIPSGNLIENNRIGIKGDGTILIPNDESGIQLDGTNNTVIRNVISGNTRYGIEVLRDSNIIRDNKIGTNNEGDSARANGEAGIALLSSSNVIDMNVISGNVNAGIVILRESQISSSPPMNNSVTGNLIGTNAAGTVAIPNTASGIIMADGANNNTIGGTASNARNIISGNAYDGILVQIGLAAGAVPPTQNKIQGNYIGTNIDGTAALPNGRNGILLSGATSTLIGGITTAIPSARNVISGNGSNGISLIDGATQTRISGNYIGTKSDGATALGNTERGIRVGVSTSNTMIGGPEQNAGNTIAYNGANGISLTSDAGNNNIIDPNRIFGNALAGIDIGENGLTPNDPTDADVGPNKQQNFPTFTLSIVGGDLIVNYRVDSAPQHSSYGASGIYVEFFKADVTGAGRDFLGSDHYLLSDYSNGQPGIRQKNLGNAASLGVAAGDSLTATATDADGNSSEFTPAFPVSSAPVTISGRVTTPTGLGLRNATVTLIAPSGERRLATTSSFGIYNFADVSSGLSYTITVTSKRYRFAPRIQTISQSASNLDFTGLE